MRGIVWDGQKLVITDDLQVRDPGPGEVKVKILRSGVCHSDLNMMSPAIMPNPVVLGHEGAGVVAQLGEGVSGLSVGDEVLLGTQTPCGECRECKRDTPHNCDINWGYAPAFPFSYQGKPAASFANCSSFAGEVVVQARQLFKTNGMAPEQAALIGCAVSTGYYAAVRLGAVRASDRVVVIGVGGIGVNAIQGAKLAGASVLAVDINPSKETVAKDFGADQFLLARRGDDGAALSKALKEAFDPIDLAIECSGAPSAVEGAIHGVKRGGRIVLIGMTAPGAKASFSLDAVLSGREVISVMNGGARPSEDYPGLIALANSGKLDLASQVTKVWPLAEYQEAIAALEAGQVTRAVLDHTR